MDLNSLIQYAKEHNASDIHLSANHPPLVRVMGEISYLNVNKLSIEDVSVILKSMLSEHQYARFQQELEIDSSVEIGGKLYRINAYHTYDGPSIALRVISENIKTFGELQIPSIVQQLATLRKGLVLVTGPCGSGKSTTLASIINYINNNFSKHIITIEDPIEYRFTSQKCLVNQRELETHTHSFARALRSALREDPDVIMLGELRDLESIQLALTAAETGHLVFSTLHTNSAHKTIDRIIDVFPSADKSLIRAMLSSSLEGIISQILLPRMDIKDRIAAYEILVATPGIRNLIRDNKGHQIPSMMEIGSKYGMITMPQYIKKLQADNVINEMVAHSVLSEVLETGQSEKGSGSGKNRQNSDMLRTYSDSTEF